MSAQVVQGVVLTADSGEPVSGARLLLRDPDGVIRAGMISSDRGRFELRADLAGMLRLEVSHIGYADWRTAAFALGTGQTLDVEVKLGIEAIPLEPIVVVARRSTGVSRTAQFLQRMNDPARVGGYFIPEEDIESRPASLASTLVVGTPGMSVRLASSAAGLERNVIMAGECQAQAFVDGIRVQQGGGASVDDVVTVDRLAGVEMYPRALGAPSQYVDTHNPRCGVVLYWTREAESSEATSWGRGRIAVGIGIVAGLITWGMVG
ncbi:MAG: carboxypeptidase-like regulatory domain-containing protein [Gemmatimonadota bacterium]